MIVAGFCIEWVASAPECRTLRVGQKVLWCSVSTNTAISTTPKETTDNVG